MKTAIATSGRTRSQQLSVKMLCVASLLSVTSGCAVFYSRTFEKSQWIPEQTPEITFSMSLRPTGLPVINDVPLTHIPFILWADYRNGPWTPELSAEDHSQHFKEITISTATIQQAGHPDKVVSVHRSYSLHEKRDGDTLTSTMRKDLPFRIWNHVDTTIRIQGSVVEKSGKRRSFIFTMNLKKSESRFVSDLVSVYASI